MKPNVGTLDKLVRIVISLLIAALYFTDYITGITGILMLILAFMLVLTTVVSFCPIYSVFGLNTCKSNTKGPIY